MQTKKKFKRFDSSDISKLLKSHFSKLMTDFYEMQSVFLSTRYKIHQSLETSNIIICLIRSAHLAIIRQREKNLDHDISLNNFGYNLHYINSIDAIAHKIVTIVNTTGIPKETVRRKLKKLVEREFIIVNKNKEYYWHLTEEREKFFIKIMKNDIKALAKFTSNIVKYINLNLDQKDIEEEIEKQFSFYFYHFLNCQLTWLKMWQDKIEDIDLVLVSLQTLIPTLQYAERNLNLKDMNLESVYTIVGKTNDQCKFSNTAISAASVSEITGIPRPTCIRKLDKLVKLGMLVRETNTKRYFVNQITSGRATHILTRENINFTIKIFSDYLAIVLNALVRNQR